MNYELAKKLKNAGFPQSKVDRRGLPTYRETLVDSNGYEEEVMFPSLSELIEACGDVWIKLIINRKKEAAILREGQGLVDDVVWYKSPEEAMSELWLTLNSK